MQAAIFHGAGRPIEIERVADPETRPSELLIEIGYCGICGSDVAMTSGSRFDYEVGKCFGHEYAGTVLEVGKNVSGWRKGDRAACLPQAGCGRCGACVEGRILLCRDGQGLAFGFAQYAAVPAAAAIRLPSSLSLMDGALVEPMACGLHALSLAGIRRGDRVLVLGAGSMGLALVWWARELGAGRIVVASRSRHRAEICGRFGADAFHSFDDDNDPAALDRELGGDPHIVAECVGKPGTLNLAIEHVRTGGTVIGMGMCMTREPVLPAALTFKEARLVFPLGYSPKEFDAAARAFDARDFSPAAMVSDIVGLTALGPTIERLRSGAKMMKVHVDPRRAG